MGTQALLPRPLTLWVQDPWGRVRGTKSRWRERWETGSVCPVLERIIVSGGGGRGWWWWRGHGEGVPGKGEALGRVGGAWGGEGLREGGWVR